MLVTVMLAEIRAARSSIEAHERASARSSHGRVHSEPAAAAVE